MGRLHGELFLSQTDAASVDRQEISNAGGAARRDLVRGGQRKRFAAVGRHAAIARFRGHSSVKTVAPGLQCDAAMNAATDAATDKPTHPKDPSATANLVTAVLVAVLLTVGVAISGRAAQGETRRPPPAAADRADLYAR